MAVKTITVTEDAYTALAMLKRGGESFSDVIRRLAHGSRSLLDFAADWKDVPADRMREYLAFLEASDVLSRERFKRIARRSSR